MVVVEGFMEIYGVPIVTLIGFFLGVMVGWSWKPRWASLGICKFQLSAPSSPYALVSSPHKDHIIKRPFVENLNSSSLHKTIKEESLAVAEEDFHHLCHLLERRDGGPSWKHFMDRSAPNMTYQAWMREPETGPPQYCSKTVYEDATPEMLRDFFWDDEFRLKWDDMIIHASTVEECPTTGTMIVHWIRKFPFFCSDREYVIGRRIWESGRTYYCVTKGVSCSSIPRQQKPRRVDLYYSSWSIQAVESRKGNGALTACEVILFHHEDMGIPREIAKFGVRQGMWWAVKKIECGFRDYQKERASSSQVSRPAFMAQINTKIDPNYLKSLETDEVLPETEVVNSCEKPGGVNIPKIVILGGVVVLACSLDRGLLTKAVVFGVARRFARIGRKTCPR